MVRELHRSIYEAAVKLSIYSTVLDIGLMLSTILLARKALPDSLSSSLLVVFDNAITYLTLMIVGMFGISAVLKHKSKIVNIYYVRQPKIAAQSMRHVKVYTIKPGEEEPIKVSAPARTGQVSDMNVESFTNKNRSSFVKFNGVWYKAGSSRFERVTAPEYN